MHPDEPGELAKLVANLEDRVFNLERRANDFALKGQILGDITPPSFETGIDRFFAEPEFWENTYDSTQADCSRRCSKDYVEHLAACDALTEPEKRQACRAEAYTTVVACHANCAG